MVVTETARLVLRTFTAEDSAPLMDIFGDEEVMRYGDGVQTLTRVKSWILGEQESYRTRGYGKWAVVDREANLLGYCGLSYVDDIGRHPEVALGYRLARRYWGHGYASEAVTATIDYGFDILGLTRLVATIDPHNTASLRVAQKVGMVYKKDVMFEGYTHPDRVYVLEK